MAEIIGTEADETLAGTDGADTIDGLEGIDTLEGGLGDDVYVVDQTVRTIDGVNGYYPDVVVEAAGAGVDTVIWTGIGGYQLADNVENFIAASRFSSPCWGNGLDNVMTAALSYDTGWGEFGSDASFYGGDGDDTLNGNAGNDDLHGDAGDDVLVGHFDLNDLPGAPDEDTLDGGAGADTMTGGRGADVYICDDTGDLVVEAAAPAELSELEAYYAFHWDTVHWTGTGAYQLSANIEHLHLSGEGVQAIGAAGSEVLWSDHGSYDRWGEQTPVRDVTMDGAAGDDTVLGGMGADDLFGGEDDDQLNGGYGVDTLHGGAGDDNLVGDPDGVQPQNESDTLFGDAGADILDGGFGDDSLNGGADGDVLLGNYGDDTMTGGEGADRFSGGAGVNLVTDFTDGEDFILAGRNLDGVVIEQAENGVDTIVRYADENDFVLVLAGVQASTVTAEDFVFLLAGEATDDSLTGGNQDDVVIGGEGDDTVDGAGGADDVNGGVGDDSLGGGGGDDTVDGGVGDDTLVGGSGDDTLNGGSGDDTYEVDDGDVVVEDSGDGIDTVETSDSYSLGANVENLDMTEPSGGAGALMATAAGVARTVGRGNGLDNRIEGNSVANALIGRDGADRLLGEGGADKLAGGDGRDILDGGAGRDILIGGDGRDVLKGGGGGDVFQFARLSDGGDRIADYAAAAGDVIDLSRIDANANRAGDQDFSFVEAFTGRARQAVLSYDVGKERTTLRLDADGDGAADFTLTISGQVGADSDGWVL